MSGAHRVRQQVGREERQSRDLRHPVSAGARVLQPRGGGAPPRPAPPAAARPRPRAPAAGRLHQRREQRRREAPHRRQEGEDYLGMIANVIFINIYGALN